MPWKVSFSRDATAFLSRLQKQDAQRIFEKIQEASQDPTRFFQRLSGQDDFKLRIGDYRVIALLLHSDDTVFIEKIGHRKNVYK